MRFFGAQVAQSAFINTTYFNEAPLVTISADAVVDDHSPILAHVLAHGSLIFQESVVGRGAILHPVSVTWAGDVVPDGVIFGPKTQLGLGGQRVYKTSRAGSYMQGCPAQDHTELYTQAINFDPSTEAN